MPALENARLADPDARMVPGGLPRVSAGESRRLLGALLKGVSRAFYLTLRVLPARLREPVGLAYLLARAADTIADTRLLPPGERLVQLLRFRAQAEGPASADALRALAAALEEKQGHASERALLAALPQAFALLEGLAPEDRARVRAVVVTLTQGMELDLKTFPAEDAGRVVALQEVEDLERYTYLVAGCVGEFWTKMAVAHTPALQSWDVPRMSETGVRFGKALQYTNVLRDAPKDLAQGRCYLPEAELRAAGLTPADLRDPRNSARARQVLLSGMRRALEHYVHAEAYVLAIPRRCVRLRLAALWPLLIGLATLAKLARNPAWLDPARPSKVTRFWVYRMLALSTLFVWADAPLRGWIAAQRKEVTAAMSET